MSVALEKSQSHSTVIVGSEFQPSCEPITRSQKIEKLNIHNQKKFISSLKSRYQTEAKDTNITRQYTKTNSKFSVNSSLHCKITSVLPIVDDSQQDDIDNCDYLSPPIPIQSHCSLIFTTKIESPKRRSSYTPSIDKEVVGNKIIKIQKLNNRKSPLSKKAYSLQKETLIRPIRSSSLKKKDAYKEKGIRKKVSFSTKKTIFRYIPLQ